jgi:hypothetical protein
LNLSCSYPKKVAKKNQKSAEKISKLEKSQRMLKISFFELFLEKTI